jgi:hypothetical protein
MLPLQTSSCSLVADVRGCRNCVRRQPFSGAHSAASASVSVLKACATSAQLYCQSVNEALIAIHEAVTVCDLGTGRTYALSAFVFLIIKLSF